MSSAVPAATPFGPTGKVVFDRTYSRTKADGSKETWPETVERVARGNLELVYGPSVDWPFGSAAWEEYDRLVHYMNEFALLPAGRHLWATGVEGRQYLFNCHVAGWGDKLSEHFEFSFLRLMEGGGVGANYSTKHIAKFGAPRRKIDLRIVCDEDHADYAELAPHLDERSTWYYGGPVEDSREGWAFALTELIDSYYDGIEGSDDGYEVTRYTIPDDYPLQFNVSGVRPSGSELKTFGGTASGPAPFAAMMHTVADILNASFDHGALTPLDVMEIDHAIAECVVSGGNRRSARMSIVKWDDPYIMDFLACKQDTGKHWTTNISVEIDDEFLKALSRPYRFEDNHQAHGVHAAVVKGMLENGEPGYWNSSLSAVGELNPPIATNPCGEIALEPWENCNLGHVNMDYFWDKTGDELEEAHTLMTRFLIRATYGDVNDPKQQEMLLKNRRIGVGHLGVQGFWAKNGVRYSDIPEKAPRQLQHLYQVVRQAAREYAFQLRIPEPVKVTAIAPTGSVAKLPGVSEGIHPIYARHFERRVRFSMRDDAQFSTVMEAMSKGFAVEDDVYDQSGMTKVVVYPTQDILLSEVRKAGVDDSVVQSADELGVDDMLRVQAAYQKYYADNAVSYTVNVPEGALSEAELAAALAFYLPDLKGTTIMVDSSRPQAPYTRITQGQYEAAVATTIEDGTSECATGACPVK